MSDGDRAHAQLSLRGEHRVDPTSRTVALADRGDTGVSPASADSASGDRPDTAPVLTALAAGAAAQSGAENFPVALRLLPAGPRAELMRVYAYARFVDDVGDEAPGDRLRLLGAVERDVRAVPAGRAVLPPVAALTPLVRGHRLSLQPFLDLIEANRLDQHVTHYRDLDQLLGYCRLSANPVGRIVLGLAGIDAPARIAQSDAVCTALQILEHCQDVGEDARAGRVYLPADELAAAGVESTDLVASTSSPALREVVACQVDRADAMLRSGAPLVDALHGWARVAVAGFVAGGAATVAALRAADHDVLAAPVRPSRARTAREAAALLTRAVFW